MQIFHQIIQILLIIMLVLGVRKLIYGETIQIRRLLESDHVLKVGMYQVVENGCQFIIHGAVGTVDLQVNHL